jgi:two-component system chemotaxis sensor kinase CheA
MDAQKQAYREEAYELLAELEDALIELEQNPDDRNLVNRIFRAMHTLKGSGAMFGFDDIAEFTHNIETVYDLVREDKLQATKDLVTLTLAACDQVKTMLEASQNQTEINDTITLELTDAFQMMLPADDGSDEVHVKSKKDDESEKIVQSTEITYRIRFKPHSDIFKNGTNPIPLLNELHSLGECNVIGHIREIPALFDIDPESCYISWDIILTTEQDINAIRDIFIFVEDLSDIEIAKIDETSELDKEDYKRIGEILFDRGNINLKDLEQSLEKQKRIGEMLVESGKVDKADVQSALVEQEHVRTIRKKRISHDEVSSIRVASNKLDALVDLVGELVTVQARLTQTAAEKNDPDIITVAEEVERLIAELRDNAMGIRMLPIGTTFGKFKRLVRDLSMKLGKEINFTTQGAETELDKTVIEKLSDPLVHLIRNSIDHGIEQPEVRKATGKPREGSIHLSAEHSGANVLVSIYDDGSGLDENNILSKAIEKGLISEDASLSEKEIFELIFAPGFSTAKNVSNVSGRGVGMDVVTRSVESLGGSIEIQSKKNQGTTITLKLPLTLAIIDGLLVSIGQDYYVIPLGAVVECVELTQEKIKQAHGKHITKVRDELVPYIPLREKFAVNTKRPQIEQIVITEMDGYRLGFAVDRVIGKHQTVIKNMGKFLKDIEGISGATIMGDGTVALILDINKLIRRAEIEETHRAVEKGTAMQ